MKIFVIAFAVMAVATAVPADYLPPLQEIAAPVEFLTPGLQEQPIILADDGYRYKTVKKLRHRHRRDVSEIANDYLPPVEEGTFELVQQEQPFLLADDGYRYKTVKKLRLRHRRDVGEVLGEYLPPVQEAIFEELPLEGTLLSGDGYRYKTVKKIRRRRDISEIANDYLPPVEGGVIFEDIAEQPLLVDGYRYKTVRKLKYRHRH